MATARIVEVIARDEQLVLPIGSYRERYGATLSLPSTFGRKGVERILMPALAEDEIRALEESVATLRGALKSLESG